MKVLMIEGDCVPKINKSELHENVDYIFYEDKNPIFHRTHYINRMLARCKTEHAVISDSDIIIDINQLSLASEMHVRHSAVMTLPYDGRCFYIPKQLTSAFYDNPEVLFLKDHKDGMSLMNGYHTVGGIFIVSVCKYLECGWENENFKGWGPEDAERVHRLKILGSTPLRIQGEIYHMFHPRGNNSRYYNQDIATQSMEEYCKICGMMPCELRNYIASWNWTSKQLP